jgi:uncharacterized protein (TIGR02231 family)
MRSRITAAAMLAAALAFGAAPVAAEETITLGRGDAPIVDVTVYTGQALVRRLASFEAKAAGSARVVLAKLPQQVVDDSVRVRAEVGTVLMGTRIVARPVGESSLPAVQALDDEVDALDKERRRLEDERSLHDASIEQVRAIQKAQASEEGRWIKAAPAELTAMVEWARTTLAASVEARRKLDQALVALGEKKTLAERRRAELRAARDVEKDLEVEVQAKAPGKYRIEVEYVTSGASWTPFYDLRADADAKAIDVTYFGIVRQQTGEDWSGVKLALSTARPELGARPPDLAQLSVGIRSSYGYSGRYADGAPAAAEASTAESPAPEPAAPAIVAALPARMVPGEVQQAAVLPRGATVAFAIHSPETIPSDGKEKRTTIGKGSMKSENRYFTVPKVSPFAYLRATVKNEFKVPILSGQANVFFGPDFVGKSKVDLTPPGEKLDVYLGVDERLMVERKTEKRFRDLKGVFSTDVRERYEFKNVVKNTRDVPVQITLIDQVPVSTHGEVKVEDVSLAPEPSEKNEKTGERRWDLVIAAKGEGAVAVKYSVRFPQDEEHAVTGLER